MTLIDISKITMPLIKAGVDNHANCPWCDGKGCEDCDNTGIVKLKRCSGCKQMMLPEQFYGRQSRCITCYKKTYGPEYRRSLREARRK